MVTSKPLNTNINQELNRDKKTGLRQATEGTQKNDRVNVGKKGVTGDIFANQGNDNFKVQTGGVTGLLDAGGGTNALALNGTTDGFASRGGTDRITVARGSIVGDLGIQMGGGADVANIQGSVQGNIDLGAGDDQLTLGHSAITNGKIINLGSGNNQLFLEGEQSQYTILDGEKSGSPVISIKDNLTGQTHKVQGASKIFFTQAGQTLNVINGNVLELDSEGKAVSSSAAASATSTTTPTPVSTTLTPTPNVATPTSIVTTPTPTGSATISSTNDSPITMSSTNSQTTINTTPGTTLASLFTNSSSNNSILGNTDTAPTNFFDQILREFFNWFSSIMGK